MANTVNFYSASYDKIQSYIDSNVIGGFSYVLCKDEAHKNELIFVDKELKMQPIVGYEQSNIIFVDELPTEHYRTNAFYICNSIGYLYINDIPVPVFKEISESSDVLASYDQLTDVPVVNKYGVPTAPIVIGDLDIGSYAISGNYQICSSIATVYSTSRKVKFIVDIDSVNKYITKFDADKIYVYTINLETLETTQDQYATQDWVKSQGYASEDYVNQAIEDLYNRIANEVLITKVSQLENDMGYLTAENLNGIGNEEIASLF